MIESFDTNILVSPVDIEYFKRHIDPSDNKYKYVTNGIGLGETAEKTSSSNFRIGILSPWQSRQIFEESNWFIKEYFKKYAQTHPNVQLIVAGRGPRCKAFEGMQNVKVLGEVSSLKDFFSNIDVMISSNPKGCGILNRVLDSFSYKVPVLGHEASFSGFPESEGCYYSFKDYKSFCSTMDYMMSNREDMKVRADKAYEYIVKYHNWERNYDNLVEYLLKTL
jgi:glycosyltransferase involved in cell wall biosynthesis